MPTIKLDINTGIEYSPTDGLDSAVKLHNYTVGTDGSLYKLPALKNLKNTYKQDFVIEVTPHLKANEETKYERVYWMHKILDLKKFQTSVANSEKPLPPLKQEPSQGISRYYAYNLYTIDAIRRFVFLTTGSYGVVNIDYKGVRISNILGSSGLFNEFEKYVLVKQEGAAKPVDLGSLNPKIIVDFNAQYTGKDQPPDQKKLRCLFPMQYQFPGAGTDYNLNIRPRNILNCSMDATSDAIDVKPLGLEGSDTYKREKNDLAKGCCLIGNRMIFYSAFNNGIYVSEANNFQKLMKNPDSPTEPYIIVPPEEIQAITEFNGNIITFTPSGMERWLLSGDTATILQRDPTLHFDHRIRYEGSFVRANRDLYFYTDDFHVYRLNSNLTVDSVFNGTLPIYRPLEDYLDKNLNLPLAYFEMIGYRFVSIGPWLYNIDSNTWSTYSFDGWQNIEDIDPETETVVWENDIVKRTINAASDDIICTYSTICRALTYQEMQDETLFDDEKPSLIENKHQWGEVAFFTTRMFQDEQKFSLDGVMVYVRGGILKPGAKMWLKVLKGADLGDFTESDESTYGVEATYQPVDAAALGEDEREYVGRFIWEGMNLKTDRFRLQFITKEKRGIVVQSVLANISTLSDTQNYLTGSKMQGQGEG